MVARVTGKRGDGAKRVLVAMLDMGQRLPWECLLIAGGAVGVAAGASHLAQAPEAAGPPKPGCTAGDAALHARGYLDELARGAGGFGVLRLAKTELEQGAQAADSLGRISLAQQMRAIASEMESVRTKEAAEKMARRLDPIVAEGWRLGRVCGLTRNHHG